MRRAVVRVPLKRRVECVRGGGVRGRTAPRWVLVLYGSYVQRWARAREVGEGAGPCQQVPGCNIADSCFAGGGAQMSVAMRGNEMPRPGVYHVPSTVRPSVIR